MLIGCAAVAAVAFGVLVILGPGDRDQPSKVRLSQAESVSAGCGDRVEGGYEGVRADDATTIGPVEWPYVATNLRQLLRSGELRPPPATGYPYEHYPIKALAFVKAGTTVTLSVPPEQRSYLRLMYGHERAPLEGVPEVTLAACRRSTSAARQARECRWTPYQACRGRYTQFAGSILVDFDRAPEQGSCSELVVRESGRRPVRGRLFAPPAWLC